MQKIKLGDLLIEQGIIGKQELAYALKQQEQTGQKLGDILVEMNLIQEDYLLSFLANQLNLPFVNLKDYPLKPDTIKHFPEVLARRYKMVPIDIIQKTYLVATSDPTDIQGQDQLISKLSLPVRFVVSKASDIISVLNRVYSAADDIQTFADELALEFKQSNDHFEYHTLENDTPIARLLFSIIKQAYLNRASDIHIEPGEKSFRIRHRVDGLLHEQEMTEQSIFSALILRIKLMAGLDISEHRLPQDGRFTVKIDESQVDIRVSSMPVDDQESIVMRLLDKEKGILKLAELGMSAPQLALFSKHIYYPHGMILVCGPTGCGKTTTLYSALSCINTPEKKIITVEDPVEYRLDRINQIQVQPKIGLNFSTVLRSALRHDPDVLMVGEIRDKDTASIALKAAMTGHLVLSTLHTYDVITAPIRLMDMGVPPYIAASSLKLILSQRLLRCLCEKCKVATSPTMEEKDWIERNSVQPNLDKPFYKSNGCDACSMTGFKDRVGVYELLEVDHEIAFALRKNDLNQYMSCVYHQAGYQSLIEQAYHYAQQGVTSLNEAMTIGFEIESEYREHHEKVPLYRADTGK